jgi:hypothetical protein
MWLSVRRNKRDFFPFLWILSMVAGDTAWRIRRKADVPQDEAE